MDVSTSGIRELVYDTKGSAGGLGRPLPPPTTPYSVSSKRMTYVPFGGEGGRDVVHRHHLARTLGFGRPSPTDPYMHGFGGTGNDSSTVREASESMEERRGEPQPLWKSERGAV